MKVRLLSALTFCGAVGLACSPYITSEPLPPLPSSGGAGTTTAQPGGSGGGITIPRAGAGGMTVIIGAGGNPGNGGTLSSGGTSTQTGGSGSSASAGAGGSFTSAGGTAGTSGVGGALGAQAGTGSAGASAGCPRACGPTYEQFFDNEKLATLRITIDAADAGANWLDTLWQKWKHCAPFTWVPVTMQYESPDGLGNVTLPNVGMRLRGSMKRGTNSLQGFKLDVQVLDTPGAAGKRRFADLNRINTLSVEGDPSHLVPCAAYKMLRDSGLPAPRCNHLKVYVNGAYYGLMENAEQINKGYLRRHFGTNQGSLYGGSPSMSDCEADGFQDSQAQLTYSTDSFSSYASQYQLTHATASEAEQNLIPMLKCGASADDEAFKTCIAEWLDVDEWLQQIAAESVMPSLEGLTGYYRNYYLYFKPDSSAPRGGRFVVWSWDLDKTFHHQKCNTSTCDVLAGVSSYYGSKPRAKLVTRLTTLFRARYCAALKNFLDTAFKASAIDAMNTVIQPGFAGETTVNASEATTIKNFIGTRTTAVQTQIAAACP